MTPSICTMADSFQSIFKFISRKMQQKIKGRKEKLGYRAELGWQVESWVRTLRVMGDDFYRNLSRIEFSVKGLVS